MSTNSNPNGRPRIELDDRRVFSFYARWRLGIVDLSTAARCMRVHPDVLKFRWAEVDEKLAAWRDEKIATARRRAKIKVRATVAMMKMREAA